MDSLAPDYYRDESAATSLADAKACIEHIRSIDPHFDQVSPIITPRFAPSCSTESLNSLGQLHKDTGVPIQTHISENLQEIQLVKDLFPNSTSYADVYDQAGLLTSQTILAHCVHLTPEERKLIKTRQAKISHCPASNTALTSGCAPIRSLLNEGHTIGLGTDVSGGYTPSILAGCREALFTSRHLFMSSSSSSPSSDGNGNGGTPSIKREDDVKLSVEEALYLATRGGAKVCNLEHRIGGFEVGMDWDAQMIGLDVVGGDGDGDDDAGGEGANGKMDFLETGIVDVFGHESWDDNVNKWVYGGDDRNTLAVWVKGRLVHSRGGRRGLQTS